MHPQARERAPAWRNELTLRSAEMAGEFEGGAYIGRISPTPLRLIVMRDDVTARLAVQSDAPRLFAFPAQSNFSGVKHPLDLVGDAHRAGWDVLLDAAAFVPTNRLDLEARSGHCTGQFVALVAAVPFIALVALLSFVAVLALFAPVSPIPFIPIIAVVGLTGPIIRSTCLNASS